MTRITPLDRRVLDSLTGRGKLEALLLDLGYPTVRSLALAIGEPETDVSRALSGERLRRPTMDRIRAKISEVANLSRADIDALLGGSLDGEKP
jgi:2-methylaconitate cis-trans-isomerase PrpF